MKKFAFVFQAALIISLLICFVPGGKLYSQSDNYNSYEPPIQIISVLHIDPEPMNRRLTEFRLTRENYNAAKGNILFMLDLARKYNFKMDALFNGWYMQSVLKYNDYNHIRDLIHEGHSIGTHAHPVIYNEERDMWEVIRTQEMNYDTVKRIWNDGARFVNQVLEKIGCTTENKVHCNPGSGAIMDRLMEEMGFLYPTGGTGDIGIEYFGNPLWNPMRLALERKEGYELLEDLTGKYVFVPYIPQIGNPQAHGLDLRIPQIKRHIIHLVTEWNHRESTRAEDRIWVWGAVVHPNYGTAYDDDIEEYYRWLCENFVNKKTPKGNTIAVFSKVSEVVKRYEEWEKTHPGVSSFSYIKGEPYPYTYETFINRLKDAEYKNTLNIQGVMGFKLMRGNRAMYLMWSQQGEKELDFSKELLGNIRVIDAGGNETLQPSRAIHLSEEPIIIEQN